MKKLYLLLIMLTTGFLSFSQPNIQWQKSLGGSGIDIARSIQQTTDGGYILAGNSYSNDGDVIGNNGGSDFWVVKMDSQGIFQWQKTYGGSGGDEAYSIQQTTDGGYIVAGRSNSNNGDVSGNHGVWDYWVVKLDNQGNLQWQKSFGGSAFDYAYSIQQTTDGGYFVAGYSTSNNGDVSGNHGSSDYWVIKLNSQGNLQWQKSLGGTGSEGAQSIQQTADGGYIVAGYSFSNNGDVSGNYGGRDYWIVKLDIQGNLQWQKSLGGSGSDWAHSIKQTADGGYIVAGESSSNDGAVSGNHGSKDSWVVKLNSQGNIQWQKSFGGTGDDWAQSIQQTADGGYIMAGASNSNNGDVTGNHGDFDYWVVKLDYLGNIQWQKSLGGSGSDAAIDIQQTADSGYIVAGYSYSNNGDVTINHGNADYWVVKLNPICTSLALTTTTIAANCNGGTGSATVTPAGNGPFTYLWSNNQTTQTATGLAAGTYTVTVTDDSSCVAITTVVITEPAAIVSNVSSTPTNYNSPNCNGSVSINPTSGTPPYSITWSSGTTNNLCQGWYTATITDANNCVKTDSVYVNFITGIEELNAAGISIYPNPANDIITITSLKDIGEVKIFDCTGKLILTETTQQKNFNFNISELNNGIYFLAINGQQIKLVKQ